MRFYNQQHQFYAGIDLHARTLHVCILDEGPTHVDGRGSASGLEKSNDHGSVTSQLDPLSPVFAPKCPHFTAILSAHDVLQLPTS